MNGEETSNLLGLPVKEPGEKLLYTLAQLTQQITSQHQNRRLEMAKAYLSSLAWGIKGLEEMGHRIGFRLLPPEAPKEYPKMLYKGNHWVQVENETQELSAISNGFSPQVVEPLKPQEQLAPPVPPTIKFPEMTDERDEIAGTADDEI
jgi:hypothetical protein